LLGDLIIPGSVVQLFKKNKMIKILKVFLLKNLMLIT
jgi:hypothetical protein